MTTPGASRNMVNFPKSVADHEFDDALSGQPNRSATPHDTFFDVNDKSFQDTPFEQATKSTADYASGQIASFAAATDAAVTDVTIDGMDKLLEMARRVANKEIVYKDGHLFEAILAHKENVSFVKNGSAVRTVITHLEGDHRNPADLVRRLGDDVVSKAQAKYTTSDGLIEPLLAPKNAQKLSSFARILADPKYDGMDLYVQSNDVERIKAELLRKAEAASDPITKEGYISASRRLVSHDTSAAEVRVARKYTSSYAVRTELGAVGTEMIVTASTAAVSGGVVGGAISIVKNSIAVSRGDISVSDASILVAKDTGKSAGRSALTGAVGTGIRYGGQKAGIALLGKSNIATAVAASVIDIGATILSFSKGEISGEQATERIGQNGTSTISSIYVGAAAGALFGPIGAVVGSIAGYLVASSLYGACLATIRAGRLAEQEATRVEALCAEAIQVMRSERQAFENQIGAMLSKQKEDFELCFAVIDRGLDSEDSIEAIHGVAGLLHVFGEKLLFASFEEFDDFMEDPNSKLAF